MYISVHVSTNVLVGMWLKECLHFIVTTKIKLLNHVLVNVVERMKIAVCCGYMCTCSNYIIMCK